MKVSGYVNLTAFFSSRLYPTAEAAMAGRVANGRYLGPPVYIEHEYEEN